jgi:c-di-GMP-binding flagellar brake protein YcgR
MNTRFFEGGNMMEDVRFGKERRKQPRFSVTLPLEYNQIHDSRPRTGLLINLNDKGFLFHCRAKMSVGTTLKVRVMFADEYELTSFEVSAKIIWKDLHFEKDWREYKYGTEFTNISEDAKEKLIRLLSAYSSKGGLKNNGVSSNRDNHTHPIDSQAA